MKLEFQRIFCAILAGIVLVVTDPAAMTSRAQEASPVQLPPAPQPAPAQEPEPAADPHPVQRLEPVDEADRDPSFRAFRDRLLLAARRRDEAFVLSITSPEIEYNLEADEGISGFQQFWMIGQRARFWRELETVLRLGATVTEMSEDGPREFCAPYVYGLWPDELDSLDHRAIVASDVKVRAAPTSTGTVLATLSYQLIRTEFVADRRQPRDAVGPLWVKVVTPDGIRGYVHRDSVRDVADVHACFRKVGQRWQMRAFITGD